MTLLKTSLAACVVALAGLAATPSQAALTMGSIPGGAATNEFLSNDWGGGAIGEVEGWYGAQLYLSGGPSQITVDYFGAEAGFNNSFAAFGNPSCSFNHAGGTTTFTGGVLNSCVVNNVASGLLNFAFTSALPGVSTNGTNPDNSTSNTPNFFVSLTSMAGLGGLDNNGDNSTPGSGQIAWLFFDDGGAGDDDNHDDMVVRLTITGGSINIPEPGTIALLGAALLGLGAVRRRRAGK